MAEVTPWRGNVLQLEVACDTGLACVTGVSSVLPISQLESVNSVSCPSLCPSLTVHPTARHH
jgi:hypothetical protein